MPNLAPVPEVKKVFLPSTSDLPETEKWWVLLKAGRILGGDMIDVAGIEDEDIKLKSLIANRIQDWNVTDNDQKAEINAANVSRLEPEDLALLITELELDKTPGLDDEQKKSSLTSSEPQLTV